MKKSKKALKVIPLGGLCEIGKNMTAFEYGEDIIIVDVGMAFAEENMPGVDCVIQDYTYIRNNISKLRGILLTHGHEDHIGSLPYFLREFKCPVYGGKLNVGGNVEFGALLLNTRGDNTPLNVTGTSVCFRSFRSARIFSICPSIFFCGSVSSCLCMSKPGR